MSELTIVDKNRYVECFGNLNEYSHKCTTCAISSKCLEMSESIKSDESFKPGKWRKGFGKPARDKKSERPQQ